MVVYQRCWIVSIEFISIVVVDVICKNKLETAFTNQYSKSSYYFRNHYYYVAYIDTYSL